MRAPRAMMLLSRKTMMDALPDLSMARLIKNTPSKEAIAQDTPKIRLICRFRSPESPYTMAAALEEKRTMRVGGGCSHFGIGSQGTAAEGPAQRRPQCQTDLLRTHSGSIAHAMCEKTCTSDSQHQKGEPLPCKGVRTRYMNCKEQGRRKNTSQSSLTTLEHGTIPGLGITEEGYSS